MSGEAAQEEVKVMVEKLKLEDKRDAVVSGTNGLCFLHPSLDSFYSCSYGASVQGLWL